MAGRKPKTARKDDEPRPGLDEQGRPSFQRLQRRALLQRTADIQRAALELPATYYVFDFLGFEDFDLRIRKRSLT